jgi:hypothetical protein
LDSLNNSKPLKRILLAWGDLPNTDPHTGHLDIKKFPEPILDSFERWLIAGKNLAYLYSIDFSDQPEIQELKPALQDIQYKSDDNLGTYDDAWLGVKNTFINKELILTQGDISRAKNTFKSAILIAAGPSMNEAWENISNECLIIACDVMYQKCLEKGITPHIIVTTERVPMADCFFRNTPQESLLVSTFMADPLALKEWSGPHNFVLRKDYPGRWYPLKKRKTMAEHASVIPTALEICGMLGIKNVLLLGQDLCFQDGSSHADLGEGLKKEKAEIERSENEEHKILVECHDGLFRDSTAVWLTIKDAIPRCAKDWGLSISSAAKKGAKIPGVSLVDPTIWYQQNPLGGTFTPELLNKFEKEDREAWEERTEKTKNFYKRFLANPNAYEPINLLYDPNMMLINNMIARDYVVYLHFRFQSMTDADYEKAKSDYLGVLQRAVKDVLGALNG